MDSLDQELKAILAEDFNSFIQLGKALIMITVRMAERGQKFGSVDFSKPVNESGEPAYQPDNQNRVLLTSSCLHKLASYIPMDTPFSKLDVRREVDIKSAVQVWMSIKQPPKVVKPMSNSEIAQKLKAVAELRKRQGDTNSHRAHLKAAGLIAASKTPITSGAEAQKIKGIGPKIAAKVDEIIATRTLAILDQRSPTDIILETFQGIWGTGLATARHWFELGHKSIADIRAAVERDEIALTRQQKVGLDHYEDFNTEMTRDQMAAIGDVVKGVAEPGWNVILVGSYRRGKLSSKDVDIMLLPGATSGASTNVARGSAQTVRKSHDTCSKLVTALKEARGEHVVVPSHGEHQMLGAIQMNGTWRRFDVFIAAQDEMACGLLAHTGPAEYNKRMRAAAQEKGWILNEKHLCDHNIRGPDGAPKIIETATEADVQRLLGFEVLEPEQRK